MAKAILKIKAVKRPISADVIGFRIQAAVPNNAGRGFGGREVPSFRAPYLIAESSDHSALDDKDIQRFANDLRFHGYREFDVVSDDRLTN